MGRASTRTKLPLTVWAKLFGMHPLHFNQVRLVDNPHCDHIMFQYEWQAADHVGREEIAQAIAEAETRIENALRYRLAPGWEVDEWHPTHRPFNSAMVNLNSADSRGYNQTVRANWGYMISGGREAKDLVSAEANIVYTDVDGDNYFEKATVTVATVAQDKNEIAVFYPGHSGDDAWEIRPINVVISGGTVTITFRREECVIEDLLEAYDIEGGEALGTDDDAFLTEVDVYRRYNDPQTQASFLWEPMANGWCAVCNGSGCASCAYSAQTGCLIVRGDPRQSIIAYHPAEWDSVENEFTNHSWDVSRQPDIVRLYYYAGWRNKSQEYVSRMDPQWERAVAYMAAAQLDRPPCDCAKGNWNKWREDLTLVSGDEDGKAYYREPGGIFGKSILDNPFGSRRGEIYAWRKVAPLIIGTSVDL